MAKDVDVIAELRAEVEAMRAEMRAVKAVTGATSQSEDVVKAIAKVLREELHPTMDDRLGKRERREGEPRTFVPAVSAVTGARFTAVLRPDGTCERLDEYVYPEMKFSPNSFLLGPNGAPTNELTQEAKWERYKQTQMKDIIAYVGRDRAFPVEARADMQPKLEALRAQIAAETARLTAEAGPLVPPAG